MTPPLSVYVHLPWCVRKCPYCDFNSHAAPDALPEAAYLDALWRDLETREPDSRPVQSVFIGGGTPSLFSGAGIRALLDGLHQRLTLAPDVEITLEANPGTAETGRFADYREAGVNRLSLGVQSFDDRLLTALGRIHSAAEAQRAVTLARRAGFDNLNMDLMHGLPGQSTADARADLDRALELAPEHLSWYQLTLEPNTVFYRHPPRLPAEDTLAAIQDGGETRLTAAGYTRYEVSAWARPGYQCRHNRHYWTFGDYLGLGAGAHGKLTGPGHRVVRYWNTRRPEDFLDPGTACQAGERALTDEEKPLEFLMNALRLCAGVPANLFTARTGLPLTVLEPTLTQLRKRGLMATDRHRLAPTALGQRFLNETLAAFL